MSIALQQVLAASPAPRRAQRLHVAIISDGNGRWATPRSLPRSAGHRAGAEAARRVIRAAPLLGIHTLTLFALSSANWKRPASEVNGILRLLHEYLLIETSHCVEEGVRLSIIGRRDRLPATLREAIADSEALTARGARLHLRLAVDYSARSNLSCGLPLLQSHGTVARFLFQRARGSSAWRLNRSGSAHSHRRRAAPLPLSPSGIPLPRIRFPPH